jgi:hypothetical protein
MFSMISNVFLLDSMTNEGMTGETPESPYTSVISVINKAVENLGGTNQDRRLKRHIANWVTYAKVIQDR